MNEAFLFLSSHEPIFKQIVAEYGLPIIPVRPQGFEALVLLILEQQVSIDSAKATFLRLKNKVNNIQPETLVTLTVEDFRIFGVSRQKASYLVGLSKTIMNKDLSLDGLSRKTVVEVRDELIKIKGIGHWTIDVYLMFSLQAPDILPIGDVAVQTTLKEMLGIHNKEEMLLYAEKWSPYRSYATFLLWHYYLKKRNRKISYNF